MLNLSVALELCAVISVGIPTISRFLNRALIDSLDNTEVSKYGSAPDDANPFRENVLHKSFGMYLLEFKAENQKLMRRMIMTIFKICNLAFLGELLRFVS